MMITRTKAPSMINRAIRLEMSFDVIHGDVLKTSYTMQALVSAVHPGPTLLDAARDMLLTDWQFLRIFTPDQARNVRIAKVLGRETI